jgi:hypothetical protein
MHTKLTKKAISLLRPFSLLILAALILSSCHDEDDPCFESVLRGKWKSADPTVYSGTLEIGYDYITITGYDENQTPVAGDDTKRPFREFTKGVTFDGYSENGRIFIKYTGWKEVPYYYQESRDGKRLLEFNFNGRPEQLIKI